MRRDAAECAQEANLSIILMAAVWERIFTRAQQTIMLALADHARDDGSHVYPSMALLAWKSSYSLRQVKRIVDELRRLTVLTVVARARRGRPTEYKINLEAVPAKPILARKSHIAAPQSRNN